MNGTLLPATLAPTSLVPDGLSIQHALSAAIGSVTRQPSAAPSLLVLAVLVLSVLIGFQRGFTREILGLANWGTACILAASYRHACGDWAFPRMDSRQVADGLGFAIVFFVSLIAGMFLSSFLARMIRVSPLAGLDRLLGMVFGALRGGAIIVVFYLMTGWIVATKAQAENISPESTGSGGIMSTLSYMAPLIAKLVPPDLAPAGGSRHDQTRPDAPAQLTQRSPDRSLR